MSRYSISLILITYLLTSCARQTTPEGGPKDAEFPKLTDSKPANNQLNYHEKVLTFNFSEDIKLKDPKEEIIISPTPPKDLTYVALNNKVTIQTKEKWADTTTYSISFREAVQDVTESNPVENLRIAFSTSGQIDSLQLTGTVYNLLSEKTPDKITVAITASDTFNIFQHTPVYFTKADKKGHFLLTNLKPGRYKLYAFEDKNKNLKIETISEAFGQLPNKIELPLTADTLRIPLLRMDSRKIKLTQVRHNDTYTSIQFNKPLTTYTTDMPQKAALNTFNLDHKEIHFYHNVSKEDSMSIHLRVEDSLTQTLDTIIYLKKGKSQPVKDIYKLDNPTASIERDSHLFKAFITSTLPIQQINLDSMCLKIDSVRQLYFTKEDIQYDTIQRTITLTKSIEPKLLDSKDPIQFIIPKTTFISAYHDTLKAILRSIKPTQPEDVGTLRLTVETMKTNYIVQLLTLENKIQQTAKNTINVIFKNIPAAEYRIRVFLDTNNNNKWDPGNINKNIPPEPTYYQTNNQKFEFPLRANWDVGPYKIKF